jgi:predicted extracellular nuclease
VNAANGTEYTAVSFETSDARGIEVGFLYDANRTMLLDAYQMSGPDVEAWYGPDSPSPGREPLVGVFEIMNREVTIVGNHFKSKGGDDPLYGVTWPPIRVTEVQRKGQAQVVRDFVNTILDEDPDALVMVAGDLNDFHFSEPGEGPDNPVAILEGGDDEVPLINLATMEKPAETFSFVFDGNSQLLDHILVSPGLYDYFKAVDILHFNNLAPATLFDEDPTTTLEASDHDPVESRFFFK